MTGILFHGADVFDSGWAARIIKAFSGRCRARLMLAGTMSRTALFDSRINGVETPGLQPSKCIKLLEKDCSAVLLATFSKSLHSGLVFGSIVAGHAAASVPVVQAECSGLVFAQQPASFLLLELACEIQIQSESIGDLAKSLNTEGKCVYLRQSISPFLDWT